MHCTRIHLIRHGQVEGFEQKRYNGQGEVALTDEGRRQYHRLRERYRNVPLKAVYSSDLLRCSIGAEIIAEPHGFSPVLLPGLRELHIGEWEGLPWSEIEKKSPELWQARLNDIVHIPAPGGETLLQMASRVRQALKEIICLHRGDEVLVIGHGGVNRAILLDALGAPLDRVFSLEQSFACTNLIDYHPDGSSVVHWMNLREGQL